MSMLVRSMAAAGTMLVLACLFASFLIVSGESGGIVESSGQIWRIF